MIQNKYDPSISNIIINSVESPAWKQTWNQVDLYTRQDISFLIQVSISRSVSVKIHRPVLDQVMESLNKGIEE